MILENKRQNDTYMRQHVEIFDDVASLRKNLFENFKEELAPAVDLESFHLGYYDEKNRKLTITNNSQLVEAYSSAKDGWVKLWADPHIAACRSKATNMSKRTFPQFLAFQANGEANEGEQYESVY